MEEQVSPQRTKEEIEKDYHLSCAKLGDITYKMSIWEFEASQIKDHLRKVNQEAHALQQLAAAPKEEAPTQQVKEGNA